jgi:hypothetical protein
MSELQEETPNEKNKELYDTLTNDICKYIKSYYPIRCQLGSSNIQQLEEFDVDGSSHQQILMRLIDIFYENIKNQVNWYNDNDNKSSYNSDYIINIINNHYNQNYKNDKKNFEGKKLATGETKYQGFLKCIALIFAIFTHPYHENKYLHRYIDELIERLRLFNSFSFFTPFKIKKRDDEGGSDEQSKTELDKIISRLESIKIMQSENK